MSDEHLDLCTDVYVNLIVSRKLCYECVRLNKQIKAAYYIVNRVIFIRIGAL